MFRNGMRNSRNPAFVGTGHPRGGKGKKKGRQENRVAECALTLIAQKPGTGRGRGGKKKEKKRKRV